MAWQRVLHSPRHLTWNFLAISAVGILRSAIGFGPSVHDRKSNEMIIESDGSSFASVSLKGKSSRTKFKPYNQDSYFYRLLDNFRLVGVCDGHGPLGHNVSSHIAQQISHYIEQHQPENVPLDINPDEWLHDIVSHTVTEMGQTRHAETKRSGSTLVFSYIYDDAHSQQRVLYTANVGDSRAIVCYKDPKIDWILSTKQLNVEHSPQCEEERKRVYANGGYIDRRGYVSHSATPYGINMTRSLGDDDIHYNNIVSSEADIVRYEITPHDVCVVHATDGIWDMMQNEEVAAIISNHLPDLKQAAIEIVHECEQRWRMYAGRVDDITITIVALKDDLLDRDR